MSGPAITKLSKARARMLIDQPFYATILLSTPMKATEDIPTAATDMKSIFYNPKFFEPLSVDESKGVLAHEVLHMALMHGLRKGHRNHQLWNFACDYAINPMLKNAGFVLPKPHLDDAKYHGMSAEHIYELLVQDVKDGKIKVKYVQDQAGALGDDLKDILGDGPMSDPAEQAKAERQIRQKVAQATNMARMAGKLPADLERLVGEILGGKVPWTDLLRDYCTRITKNEESWTKRNRRFGDIYLPSRYSQRLGVIGFIGDTSGSISEEENKKAANEGYSIFEGMKPEKFVCLWADTRVASEQVFEEGDLFNPVPAGGGGTDMRVPMEYIAQYDPEVVILMTDGYTPWPDSEPPYPLIVCCTTDVEVPFGMVIRV